MAEKLETLLPNLLEAYKEVAKNLLELVNKQDVFEDIKTSLEIEKPSERLIATIVASPTFAAAKAGLPVTGLAPEALIPGKEAAAEEAAKAAKKAEKAGVSMFKKIGKGALKILLPLTDTSSFFDKLFEPLEIFNELAAAGGSMMSAMFNPVVEQAIRNFEAWIIPMEFFTGLGTLITARLAEIIGFFELLGVETKETMLGTQDVQEGLNDVWEGFVALGDYLATVGEELFEELGVYIFGYQEDTDEAAETTGDYGQAIHNFEWGTVGPRGSLTKWLAEAPARMKEGLQLMTDMFALIDADAIKESVMNAIGRVFLDALVDVIGQIWEFFGGIPISEIGTI